MSATPPTSFSRVRRSPKLATYDRKVMDDILDAARFAHVGHIIDGRPVVIPTLHWRIGDRVYWHGSAGSRMLIATRGGAEVCLSVTIMDAWVMARSAFNHAAQYRSLMCFGTPEAVLDRAEKAAVLRAFMDKRFPGRWDQLRPIENSTSRSSSRSRSSKLPRRLAIPAPAIRRPMYPGRCGPVYCRC